MFVKGISAKQVNPDMTLKLNLAQNRINMIEFNPYAFIFLAKVLMYETLILTIYKQIIGELVEKMQLTGSDLEQATSFDFSLGR